MMSRKKVYLVAGISVGVVVLAVGAWLFFSSPTWFYGEWELARRIPHHPIGGKTCIHLKITEDHFTVYWKPEGGHGYEYAIGATRLFDGGSVIRLEGESDEEVPGRRGLQGMELTFRREGEYLVLLMGVTTAMQKPYAKFRRAE
jgi:hypothetical protein